MCALTASELEVREIGSGPPVLLVHGSVVGANRTWRRQLPLAQHWTLRLVYRPGFGASPPLERGDYAVEAPLIAKLLGDGAHLVGHSYGAVIALHAAALRPHAVRSLTVSEPGCLRIAAGDPRVDPMIAHGDMLYDSAARLGPDEFLRAFRSGAGSANYTPSHLGDELLAGARLLMKERRPWETDPPLEQLARAGMPALVISGDHSPAFDAVCDVIAAALNARRAVIAGRGHTIPSTGAPYNALLHEFLSACERR